MGSSGHTRDSSWDHDLSEETLNTAVLLWNPRLLSLALSSSPHLKPAGEQAICLFNAFQLKHGKREACVPYGERPIMVFNTFGSLETVPAQVKLLIKWHLCLYPCCPHNVNVKCPPILIASKKTAFVCSEKRKEKSTLRYIDWLPMYFNGTLSPWYPGTRTPAVNWEREHQTHSCVASLVWILGHESFESVPFVLTSRRPT